MVRIFLQTTQREPISIDVEDGDTVFMSDYEDYNMTYPCEVFSPVSIDEERAQESSDEELDSQDPDGLSDESWKLVKRAFVKNMHEKYQYGYFWRDDDEVFEANYRECLKDALQQIIPGVPKKGDDDDDADKKPQIATERYDISSAGEAVTIAAFRTWT